MAKITTPVEGFTGVVAGVTFSDGTGSTKDEGALAYFERQGYTIDGAEPADVQFPDGPPAEEWTKKQLEAFAEREGFELGSVKSKGEVWTAVSEAVTAKAAAESGNTPGAE